MHFMIIFLNTKLKIKAGYSSLIKIRLGRLIKISLSIEGRSIIV